MDKEGAVVPNSPSRAGVAILNRPVFNIWGSREGGVAEMWGGCFKELKERLSADCRLLYAVCCMLYAAAAGTPASVERENFLLCKGRACELHNICAKGQPHPLSINA